MKDDAPKKRADDEEGPVVHSEEELERVRTERIRDAEEATRAIVERHRETIDKLAE